MIHNNCNYNGKGDENDDEDDDNDNDNDDDNFDDYCCRLLFLLLLKLMK